MFTGLIYERLGKLSDSFNFYQKASYVVSPNQDLVWKRIYDIITNPEWQNPIDDFSLKVVDELLKGLF